MSTFEEVEEEDDKEEDDDIEENNPEEAAENTNFVWCVSFLTLFQVFQLSHDIRSVIQNMRVIHV